MPIRRDPTTCALPAVNSKNVRGFVALLRLNDRATPNSVVFTVDALTAKGATSVTVTPAFEGAATETTMAARQPLQWFDAATDTVGIVFAAADYTDGTTITLEPAEEEIPAGATIEYPVRLQLRGDMQTSTTTNVIEADTLDHSFSDAVPGTRSATNNLPGLKNHFDAGLWTCIRADEGGDCDTTVGSEIYLRIEEPVPGTNVANWTRGDSDEGVFFVTGINKGNGNNANRTADITGRFTSFAQNLAVPV